MAGLNVNHEGLPDHTCRDKEVIFSFGVIADVQYGNLENGQNYSKTRWRYYRNSLNLLKEAVDAWKMLELPCFVLQLGDLIDGFNKRAHSSSDALDETIKAFDQMSVKVHHIIGNHELYNFSKKELLQGPLFQNGHKPDKTRAYYDFSPYRGYRFVVLDCYDIAMLGYEPTDDRYIEAERQLRNHNKNEDLNSPTGLKSLNRRFLKFNGGLGQSQLDWLECVLAQAENDQEQVIISGHIPLYEESADPMCLVWNNEQVLEILQKHAACVAVYMCGHDHDGGYAVDKAGIHHITMPGIIETEPGTNAFGTWNVYENCMELKGVGRVPNMTVHFKNIAVKET